MNNHFNKFKKFTILFMVIFVLDTMAANYLGEMRLITKPMIMASLIGLYIFEVRERQSRWLIVGMITAMVGDILLVFPDDSFFMAGLISFLVMQLSYSLDFNTYYEKKTGALKYAMYALLGISLVFLGLGVGKLGSMVVPVILYTFAILGMAILGLSRWRTQNLYHPVAWGVILFVISDLLLATNKFLFEIPAAGFAVMLSYVAAQYFIITGCIADEHKVAALRALQSKKSKK